MELMGLPGDTQQLPYTHPPPLAAKPPSQQALFPGFAVFPRLGVGWFPYGFDLWLLLEAVIPLSHFSKLGTLSIIFNESILQVSCLVTHLPSSWGKFS